jgi:23S rRNA (cytosine1962-C5)-methyltransferase
LNPFAADRESVISTTGVRRLRRGHLWIYAGDVEREPKGEPPAIVKVTDSAGNVHGYAFYSRKSQIRLRMLSRDSEPPTPAFLRARIRAAGSRRPPQSPETAQRLIFGESDLLPSIIVDRYGEYLVLQTLSAGAEALKPMLVDILAEEFHSKGILERNDVKTRLLEGLTEISGVLHGEIPDEVEIAEGAVKFRVRLRQGQKTGFFLDQSRNRISAGKYAHGRGMDCFSNTGGFGLHFAARCESVLLVDISAESIDLARRNAELNGFKNTEFRLANAFDCLRDLEKAGEKFDIISLDPPAFAKNRASIEGAKSGYKEINLRALKLLRPDGILVTSSCSYHMSEELFEAVIQESAHDAHRYVQVLERRGQSPDHPVLMGMPETKYLKCFILRAP